MEKAKAIASKARLELEVEVAEKLGKLKEKLDSAAEKKEHHYFLKKQRIEQHLSTVEERKSTFGYEERLC